MQTRKNVIVVGMARSGTSMTAAIFANKGYFVAEDATEQLRQSDEFNPSGYWEAEPLIKSNAGIFKRAGYEFDNTWMFEPIGDSQAEQIHLLPISDMDRELVAKYNRNSPWIWKDPRLCYTLPYWWKLMDQENTGVLLLKRDPDEIYQSFVRLKWRKGSRQDRQDTRDRIAAHLAAAESTIRQYNIPFIEIQYSDYKLQPASTAKRISEFFGIDLTATELGFNSKLNTSSVRGRIMRYADAVADRIPDNARKKLKALVPRSLMKVIFPGRFS